MKKEKGPIRRERASRPVSSPLGPGSRPASTLHWFGEPDSVKSKVVVLVSHSHVRNQKNSTAHLIYSLFGRIARRKWLVDRRSVTHNGQILLKISLGRLDDP